MPVFRSGSAGASAGGRGLVAVSCLLLVGPFAGCSTEQRDAGVTATATIDWRDTTYELTCDGVVPGGFSARVVDGTARVPADAARPPHYDFYEVRVVGTAGGDLDGAGGADAVVLLECSPQPSNGVLQEVLLVSSSGEPLGSLPSPRTLQGTAPLPPVYDPEGLSVEDGVIVARMSAYAPEDSRADGPSVPVTVGWRYDREGVVRVSSS